jgi:hypothetical protein
MTKTCGTCRREMPLSNFYRDAREADGRRKQCKRCYDARRKGTLALAVRGTWSRVALAEARGILLAVEWAGRAENGQPACPMCHGEAPLGHAQTCRLGRFLLIPVRSLCRTPLRRVSALSVEEVRTIVDRPVASARFKVDVGDAEDSPAA